MVLNIGCNVISLKFNNTNLAECDHLLCVYLHVCISMNLLKSVLYYICIYIGDILSIWSLLIVKINLIGQSIIMCA